MDETEVETVIRLQAVDVRDLFPDFSPEDAGSRVCLLCATKLKDKTHNLTRHLERHHVGALLQLMEQRNAASPSAAAAKTASSQVIGAVGAAVNTASGASRTRKLQLQQQSQKEKEPKAHTKSNKSSQKQRGSAAVAASPIDPHAEPNEDDVSMGDDVVASTVMKADQIEHAKLALVEWLTREQLPISLVVNDGFRRFVQLLNGKFDPPEHAELQKVLENMHRQLDKGKRTSTSDPGDPDGDGDSKDSNKKKQRRVERKIVVETTALVAISRTPEDAPVVRYQQLPCGVLQRGFAQVRVHLALASHPDAMACTGRVTGKHGVLGRSFVGIVERVNPAVTAAHGHAGSHIKEQQRVALALSRLPCDVCTLKSEQSLLSCTHSQYLGVSSSRGALSEYIVIPEANLHVLPSGVPDDLALLVDDMALVIRTSNVLKQRDMEKVAVVTDGVAGCTIGLLARYVHQVLGFAQDDIHVFATSSIKHSQQEQLRQYTTLTALDISNPSALDDVLSEQLAFDGVIDMCGTEASVEFAISLVQPMGTLIFVDRGRFEAPPTGGSTALAMDMNSVVVNELEMVSICDCSAEVSEAVSYLTEQSLESESCDQLRAFLSTPVALGDALEELRRASSSSGNELKAQYLQVDCRNVGTK